MTRKLTARHIEFALAKHFNWRQNLIVPNVHWGFGLNHEADLLVLTPSLSLWEVEIKVTPGDLRADVKKRHGHRSEFIRRLYFAFPASMAKYSDLVPRDAGIILVREDCLLASVARPAKQNMAALPLTPKQVQKLHSLAAMRIWDLKLKLIRAQEKAMPI